MWRTLRLPVFEQRRGVAGAGAFTQHHMDQLDLDQTPLEYLFEMAKETEPNITYDEVSKNPIKS
jgi:hypothetical protein